MKAIITGLIFVVVFTIGVTPIAMTEAEAEEEEGDAKEEEEVKDEEQEQDDEEIVYRIDEKVTPAFATPQEAEEHAEQKKQQEPSMNIYADKNVPSIVANSSNASTILKDATDGGYDLYKKTCNLPDMRIGGLCIAAFPK